MAQKLLQYEVLERIGEGARSVIYSVVDPDSKKVYALKHVQRAETKDLRFIEQMETEYEISKQFTDAKQHAHLRRSYDLKINKTLLMKVTEAFLLMELVEGRPLEMRLPPTMIDIVDTFIAAAHGLKAMHSMGYVHCDIKPNNILRSDTGKVKVIDFGQSCKIGTIKERIQGTPDFIAPEQVKRQPVAVQTDVFNLGATLYWCLTGKHIPTLYTVNKKGEHSFLVHDRIPTPQQLNPKVPTALSNLVVDSIATSPSKRPEGMEPFITRLELAKHVLEKEAAGPKPETPALDPDDTGAHGAVS